MNACLLLLAAALLLPLSGVRADAQSTPPSLASDLEAVVNREREYQGLKPVQPSAALQKAAQAHAEDMVQNNYFALEGPPGSPTIESLVDKEGYRYTLVTEKLVRQALDEGVEDLVEGWRKNPTANRASLWSPGARDIGVGVVESGDHRIITIVLAAAEGPQPSASQAAAFSALAKDPEAARKALYELIDTQRHTWGLLPLRVDKALREAADQHAKDVLAAILANRPTSEVVALADLVEEQRARSSNAGSAVQTSGEVSRHRRPAPRGSGVGESVGNVVVTDASNPQEALDMAIQQETTALRDQRYRLVAIGLAVRPPDSATPTGRSVWVIAVATH
jgi:uncharacterized protein YkwD